MIEDFHSDLEDLPSHILVLLILHESFRGMESQTVCYKLKAPVGSNVIVQCTSSQLVQVHLINLIDSRVATEGIFIISHAVLCQRSFNSGDTAKYTRCPIS